MKEIFTYSIVICITILGTMGCKKSDDPVPVDDFNGDYQLLEVIEEFSPTDPNRSEDEFLAPELYEIIKSDILNPVTGEMVSSYKFLVGEVFMGLTVQSGSNGEAIVGTMNCPNEDDLRAVSVTLMASGSYRLNMVNCIGREVLADYTRTVPE